MTQVKASVTMYHVLLYLDLFDRASIRIQDPFVMGSDAWNFSIAPSGRTWTRFGDVREQGSVIDFYARVKGISTGEAAEELDGIFDVTKEQGQPKGFITDKVDVLRTLVGDEREDVEQMLVAAIKESYQNGKSTATWPDRFARYLFEGLNSVYERAMRKRKKRKRD